MKRKLLPILAILLAGLLTSPVMAETGKTTSVPAEQAQKKPADVKKTTVESEGRQKQKAYFQKREAAKKHRDEMLKERAKNTEAAN